MRTPEEMAHWMADHFNDSDIPYKREWIAEAAALLAAWRDECVAEARKPEAPASEDYVPIMATPSVAPDREIARLASVLGTMPERGEAWHRKAVAEITALLSRAPCAGSRCRDCLHADGTMAEALARNEKLNAEVEREARLTEEYRAQARAAEAELDQALDDLVDADNALDSLIPKLKAAEAERDDLRERVEGMTQTMREMLDHMNKDEAERDRLKGELAHGILEATNRALDKNLKLREENAALRSLVDGAEDVVELWGHATIHNGQREWAKDWLAKARELIRAKGETK